MVIPCAVHSVPYDVWVWYWDAPQSSLQLKAWNAAILTGRPDCSQVSSGNADSDIDPWKKVGAWESCLKEVFWLWAWPIHANRWGLTSQTQVFVHTTREWFCCLRKLYKFKSEELVRAFLPGSRICQTLKRTSSDSKRYFCILLFEGFCHRWYFWKLRASLTRVHEKNSVNPSQIFRTGPNLESWNRWGPSEEDLHSTNVELWLGQVGACGPYHGGVSKQKQNGCPVSCGVWGIVIFLVC